MSATVNQLFSFGAISEASVVMVISDYGGLFWNESVGKT
jgi:hypothetical protein